MENLVDTKLPLIFNAMFKLSKRSSFLAIPKKNHFRSMTELYLVLGGKTGATQRIVNELKANGILVKDSTGIYYDTDVAKNILRKSKLVEMAKRHGLGEVFA